MTGMAWWTSIWLAHLLLPIVAFTPTFSTNPSQCGQFTISWNSTAANRAGPPFNLTLIPVNDPSSTEYGSSTLSLPIQQVIPSTAWDALTSSGTYTISALAFRASERFIVSMDDGFGFGTGGVSQIQTMSPNTDVSSCLGPTGADANILFTLSSSRPAQCGTIAIVTPQASAIRGFIPGGTAFSLGLPAASTGNMRTGWDVNVAAGTYFTLVYFGTDGKIAGSGLAQSQPDAGNGATCLANDPPHSTAAPTPSQTSGPNGSSGGGGGINTAALAGGIVGGLALIAVAALLTFFCLIRRTDAMGRPKSRTTNSAQGRSTIDPYKDIDTRGGSSNGYSEAADVVGKPRGNWGRLNSDASAGLAGPAAAGGSIGRKTGSGSPPVPGATPGTLEARFGSGLFGRKKKGEGGANVPPGTTNTFTSSQRRNMYPGLSIASTQNESIGTVNLAGPTAAEDGRRTDTQPFVEDAAPAGVVSRYRDAKRREAREEAARTNDPRDSFTSDSGTGSSIPHVNEQRLEGAGRRGHDLSAIDEGTGYGSSGYPSASEPAQTRRGNSLGHSNSFRDESSGAMLLADMSGNEKSSSSDPASSSYRQPRGEPTNGRRPSTAPGSGSTPFHLPSSVVPRTTDEDTSIRLHEYPPEVKSTQDEWEPSDVASWRTGGGQHPYAVAQSPHTETSNSPFTRTATTTTTTSASSNSRRGGGGGQRRVRHPYSDVSGTEIIRHTDAGPMMDSDDDEEEEENARRRVVELPPSYGDVTSSGRGRRRGGG